MKKIITTSLISFALFGGVSAFALTPTPSTVSQKSGTGEVMSRDAYIKKAVAEGKLTQEQADTLLKKAAPSTMPMNGRASSSMKMMKNSIAETKSASKRGEAPKGLMMKNPTTKASSTKKMDTTKMGKMNPTSKPAMRPAPVQVPGATVAQ